MYESPITRITEDIMTDIVEREEGYLVESVHRVGFDIDKEELAKALRYDRDQYEKGFNDGRAYAKSMIIHCNDCKFSDWYTAVDGVRRCLCLETGASGRTEEDFCSYAEREEDGDN